MNFATYAQFLTFAEFSQGHVKLSAAPQVNALSVASTVNASGALAIFLQEMDWYCKGVSVEYVMGDNHFPVLRLMKDCSSSKDFWFNYKVKKEYLIEVILSLLGIDASREEWLYSPQQDLSAEDRYAANVYFTCHKAFRIFNEVRSVMNYNASDLYIKLLSSYKPSTAHGIAQNFFAFEISVVETFLAELVVNILGAAKSKKESDLLYIMNTIRASADAAEKRINARQNSLSFQP